MQHNPQFEEAMEHVTQRQETWTWHEVCPFAWTRFSLPWEKTWAATGTDGGHGHWTRVSTKLKSRHIERRRRANTGVCVCVCVGGWAITY